MFESTSAPDLVGSSEAMDHAAQLSPDMPTGGPALVSKAWLVRQTAFGTCTWWSDIEPGYHSIFHDISECFNHIYRIIYRIISRIIRLKFLKPWCSWLTCQRVVKVFSVPSI